MASGSKTKRSGSTPDPVDRKANAVAAAAHAAKGTRAAGQAVGALTARARKPLIVGGGALAGVAAGLALSKRR